MLLNLFDSGVARPYLKHLTELFRFLFDFAKLGEEEAQFLLTTRTISIFVDFYLKAIKQSPDNVVSIRKKQDIAKFPFIDVSSFKYPSNPRYSSENYFRVTHSVFCLFDVVLRTIIYRKKSS